MTTQDHHLPQPLIYTNVTKNDHIWQRDSPISEDTLFGRRRTSFSPPLKHITIESTQELLENFDPLDVLDSASEKSASSTDTMIMMTTEEERRNTEKIKSSLLDHELRKALGDTNLKQFHLGDKDTFQKRSIPNNYVSCQQMIDNAKQFREKPCLSGDDGYSTDSRSNTTASISSPLSSSLSSLSTSEGSPHSGGNNSSLSGSINYGSLAGSNTNMQRGPIQKGPNLLGNGRANVYKHGGFAAKRREVQVETPDNMSSLEDRLRALTTIEEEDSGLPIADRSANRNGAMGKFGDSSETYDPSGVASSPRDARYGKRTVENLNYGMSSNYGATSRGVSGYFRAVPATVVSAGTTSQGGSEMDRAYYQTSGSGVPPSPSQQTNGDGWTDYTRFFEKDCDIPLHNIDPAGRGKFSNSSVDDVPDMDINRQIGTGSPANPRKQRFSFSRDGDRMVIAPGVSDSVVNRNSPHDASGQDENTHRLPDGQGYGHFRPDIDIGANHNGGRTFHQGARQHHVMSSMPDLRYQDPAWVQGPLSGPALREQPSSFQGYPYHLQQQQHHHHHQQQQQQQQQHRGGTYSPHLLQQQQHHNAIPPSANRYLNQRPLYSASMDTLCASSNNPQEDEDDSAPASYPEVVLRRSRLTASARAAPNHPDRYSWQPGSSFDQQHLAECDRLSNMGLERSSLDLGNIPQLQKQIRATSEMCLQASRRHMFASSADIYKLFSGQKKPPMPPPSSNPGGFGSDSRGQNFRHSFHAMPGSGWPGSPQAASGAQLAQDSPRTKPKLRIMMPSVSTAEVSSAGPVRADHNINIPPEAWTSVTSLPTTAASEIDRLSFHRQPQPVSGTTDPDRHLFQRPGSANADLAIDRPSFQRQSSGYSSETELQQIESNARAIKKLHKRQGKQHVVDNHAQQFVPLNRSIDHDSNTGTDNASDLVDNEPVYVNQSMLSRAQTFDALNKPSSNSGWFTPPTSSSLPQHSSMQQPDQHLQSHKIHPEHDRFPPQSSQSTTFDSNLAYTTSKMGNRDSNSVNPYSDHTITQHQVINFNSKPVTITSHVPSSPYSFREQNEGSSSNNNRNITNNNSSNNFSSNGQINSHSKSPSDQQGHPYSYSGSPHFSMGSKSNQGNPISQTDPQSGLPGRPRRSSSNSSAQLSPVEIAQMLDVPFATNIISDEQGDRLSTLV